jgi:hypothetical protein
MNVNHNPDISNKWEVTEARAMAFEGYENEVCTLFLYVFEASVIHNEVADDDSNNLISIHRVN